MDEAVLQCVRWCLKADNPMLALAELTGRMRVDGWSESDIESVKNLVSVADMLGAVSVEAVKEKETTWLSTLEEYAAGYKAQLRANGFYRVDSANGPGMGAGIGYANRIFDFDLVNDRGQFFIYFLNLSRLSRIKAGFVFRSRANFFSQRVQFGVILGLLAATKHGKDFSELSAKEKPAYWEINYSFEDPFAAFFANLKDINELLKRTKSTKLKTSIESYYEGRGEWLFGPNAAERSLTQEERDRFPTFNGADHG